MRPRVRALIHRGDAAAATWIVSVDIFAATPRLPRGASAETAFGRDADTPSRPARAVGTSSTDLIKAGNTCEAVLNVLLDGMQPDLAFDARRRSGPSVEAPPRKTGAAAGDRRRRDRRGESAAAEDRRRRGRPAPPRETRRVRGLEAAPRRRRGESAGSRRRRGDAAVRPAWVAATGPTRAGQGACVQVLLRHRPRLPGILPRGSSFSRRRRGRDVDIPRRRVARLRSWPFCPAPKSRRPWKKTRR